MASNKRIMKELAECTSTPPPGCTIRLPNESDYLNWEIAMTGPSETVYAGGTFLLALTLPKDYPFKPPSISFKTKIYHPNVSNDERGAMCLGMLRPDEWKPPNKIKEVLGLVRGVLAAPQPDDAVEAGIAEQYRQRKPEWEKVAREWVGRGSREQSRKNDLEKGCAPFVEALPEAMSTTTPPLPQPHLPLRKASAQWRRAPRPIFTAEHDPMPHVRGFNPRTADPVTKLDPFSASSEHAYAARPERAKMVFKVPAMKAGYEREVPPLPTREEGSSSSSPLPSPRSPPGGKAPKSSKSFTGGLKSLRRRVSSKSIQKTLSGPGTPGITNEDLGTEGVRQSLRSALTSNSSLANVSSNTTDRESYRTGASSQSEYTAQSRDTTLMRESLDVEQVIRMYENGFEESRKPSLEEEAADDELVVPEPAPMSRRASAEEARLETKLAWDRKRAHRRSQSASLLDRFKAPPPEPPSESSKVVDKIVTTTFHALHLVNSRDDAPETPLRTNGLWLPALASSPGNRSPSSPMTASGPVPRDRYGFKKASHYITLDQYDAWNTGYTDHLTRRRKKWDVLMRSYGLTTHNPIRFPIKSEKVKRYVRKGIPPEWRGSAWFYYAGGPGLMKENPGQYQRLLAQVETKLSETDREHIERDLHRTFPDNIRFKPDSSGDFNTRSEHLSNEKKRRPPPEETPLIASLRRLLQVFALHNPSIGYCQSLNFIAALLLLFLNADEEKAFILLNQITTLHLPGTHGLTLSGANTDIAVLMSLVKDYLPAVWTKLTNRSPEDRRNTAGPDAALPTISLATTAWFMALFINTLPIESVLRTWDLLFFEGSKSLFRIALHIFSLSLPIIEPLQDSMEVFGAVQGFPRGLTDVNGLIEGAMRRKGGFGGVSQELIDLRRRELRDGPKLERIDTASKVNGKWKGRWRGRTVRG
ncbi:hypothetical protein B0A48_12942 [Cryoendolithus antarcticus]|uniref:E2 ubiquitin-conjugating enzyme n=1 Tax=Cryoendolithus antarcticus TaxID=1507870 RepID=A0A1V8SQE1_9PEZI|nr:hypothetical protein B0A48_12942 [Cryoendolithus antarcticus]